MGVWKDLSFYDRQAVQRSFALVVDVCLDPAKGYCYVHLCQPMDHGPRRMP